MDKILIFSLLLNILFDSEMSNYESMFQMGTHICFNACVLFKST